MGQLEALQRKYAAAARTLAAQSRMLNHLKETVQEREEALQAGQVEWLAALNEQRDRIRSLHSLVVQLSGPEDAPLLETASTTAREGAYQGKYKRAKNLLKVQAQHVCQLQEEVGSARDAQQELQEKCAGLTEKCHESNRAVTELHRAALELEEDYSRVVARAQKEAAEVATCAARSQEELEKALAAERARATAAEERAHTALRSIEAMEQAARAHVQRAECAVAAEARAQAEARTAKQKASTLSVRLVAAEAELRMAQEQVVLLDASLSAARTEMAEAHERQATTQAQMSERRASAEAEAEAAAQAALQRECDIRAALAAETAARRAAEAEAASYAGAAADAAAQHARELEAAATHEEQLLRQLNEARQAHADAVADAAAATNAQSERDADAAAQTRGSPSETAAAGLLRFDASSEPSALHGHHQRSLGTQLQVLQVGISRDEVASLRRLWQSRLEGVNSEVASLSDTVAQLQEQVAAAQHGAPEPAVRNLGSREVEVKLLTKQLAETQAVAIARTGEMEAKLIKTGQMLQERSAEAEAARSALRNVNASADGHGQLADRLQQALRDAEEFAEDAEARCEMLYTAQAALQRRLDDALSAKAALGSRCVALECEVSRLDAELTEARRTTREALSATPSLDRERGRAVFSPSSPGRRRAGSDSSGGNRSRQTVAEDEEDDEAEAPLASADGLSISTGRGSRRVTSGRGGLPAPSTFQEAHQRHPFDDPSWDLGSDEHVAGALAGEECPAGSQADERSFVSASSTSLNLRAQGSGSLAGFRAGPVGKPASEPTVGAVALAAAAARSAIRDGAVRGAYAADYMAHLQQRHVPTACTDVTKAVGGSGRTKAGKENSATPLRGRGASAMSGVGAGSMKHGGGVKGSSLAIARTLSSDRPLSPLAGVR